MGYHFHFTVCGDFQLPPVLFLHGFLGNCEEFAPTIAQLSDVFSCLALDLPGHGKTTITEITEELPKAQSPPKRGDLGGYEGLESIPDPYTMAQIASGLVSWLDRQGIARCAIVGYSMGGRVALYLALRFPDRFPKVVLESASPGWQTDWERQQRRDRDLTLSHQIESDFGSFLTNWYQQPLFHSLRQHPAFAALQERRSRQRPPELARALRGLSPGNQPSLWAQLPDAKSELLLLVGADDRKFLSLNQAMAQSCPLARLQVFPCGHVIHVECPDHFTSAVRSFLLDSRSVEC